MVENITTQGPREKYRDSACMYEEDWDQMKISAFM